MPTPPPTLDGHPAPGDARRALESLRQVEDRYQSVFETLAEGVLLQDGQHRIVAANSAAGSIFGTTAEDLVGRSIDELPGRLVWEDGSDCPPAQRPSRIAMATGAAQLGVVLGLHRPDGSLVWLSVNARPVRSGPGGAPPSVVSTFADITETVRQRAAAQEATRRSRWLADLAPVGVVVNDGRGRILASNRHAHEQLGYTAEEFSHLRIQEIDAADGPTDFGARLAQLKAGETIQFETLHRHKSGKLRRVLVRVRMLDAEPEPVMLGVWDDVTDQRQALLALEESTRWLEASQRLAGIGHYVLDIPGDRWTSSRSLDEIFGIDGAHPHTIATWAELVHPADRERMAGYFAGLLASGSRFDSEYRVVDRRTGAERWVHGLGEIQRDGQGRPIQMFGTIQDITGRRRAEQSLRDSEARLAQSQHKLLAHLEQTLFAVIEFDERSRVVYWNPAAEKIFGYARAEALGRTARELLIPEGDVEPLREVWRSLLAQSGGRHSVNENRTRDGRTITCEWFNTTLFDPAGKVTGVMSLASDVTDRARREEAQARVQKLESLAVMAGGLAHDFNNLLTGILANISLVALDDPPPDERREMLLEAERAAVRAQSLARQLLTFARGGAPVKEPLDLRPLVRDAATFATHGSTCGARFDFGEALWPVEADAGQVGQVVQNLVLNAAEAMREGGCVSVQLSNRMVDEPPAPSRPGPYVRLTVSDSGVGIPAGVLSRIFDPFFSTKGRGSGLGLTVTHSIVARHGGYVEVSSRPGEGTRFEINLPAQPGVGPAEEPAPPAPGRLSARVLLMDDEESIRSVGARALTLAGCAVETAANGAAALAAFETARRTGAPFDVVILDLTVPEGMGGLEALEALRRLDPAVCAVASSGYSMAAAMSDFRARGFAAALPKPWSVTQLRQVVAALEQGAAPPGGT